ncbi:MAG: hypothetical protein K5695_09550 [Oscillospiraceae bacterium]|nr:hypothetical protein [Oscillospiraceae bacterium]
MNWERVISGMKGDIVLDEAAFERAVNDLADLAVQLQNLRDDVEGLLNTLQSGFDTPAGRKFIGSCRNNLIQPLEQQKLVIEHISSTLNDVKGAYSPVFTEYESLNKQIQSYQT